MVEKKIMKIIKYFAIILGIAAFAAVAFLISAFAFGWRIDFSNFKTYRSGVLTVQSNPSGAQVYLDGKKIYQKTPLDIRDLKPGKYLLKVEKDDFLPWEKKVEVKSGMVTREENIILFAKKIEEELVVKEKIDKVTKSPNGQAAAFEIIEEQNRGVWLLNFLTKQQTKLFPLTTQHLEKNYSILKMFWGLDSECLFIVIKSGEELSAILLPTYNPKDYIEFPLSGVPSQVIADFPRGQSYVLIEGKLILLTPDQQKTILTNISQFVEINNTVYAIQNSPKGSTISSFSIERLQPEIIISSPSQLNFISSRNLLLTDEKNKLFYLADKKIIPLEIEAEYLQDKDDTIASDGFSLYLLKLDSSQQKTLLTRLSEKFQLLWEIDRYHFILSDSHGLFVIDADGTNKNYLNKTGVFLGMADKKIFIFENGLKSLKIR